MSPVKDEKIDDGKITCMIDGGRCHSIFHHLREKNPSWTEEEIKAAVEQYARDYPQAPLFSELAKSIIAKKRAEKASGSKPAATGFERRPLWQVFEMPANVANNSRGQPIEVSVLNDHDDDMAALVPDVDPNYVFNIELVKTTIIGFETNETMYYWGYHGTGKSTIFEQVAARTRRPFLRLQHTINTEEAHIIGQYIVKDGSTEFQIGPLPYAMINGIVYCADEYDFALPSVTSVYQAVLEGKPLFIKDAPPELRLIRPHPNFRFCATGNTNGQGDETGLYQGTQLQNAANYSRFGIVEEVEYMHPNIEAAIVAAQSGITRTDADKLVEFAGKVREQFKAGKIGMTVSPRELIKIGKNAVLRGGNYRIALRQGFLNRCSRTDKTALDEVAQRMFG